MHVPPLPGQQRGGHVCIDIYIYIYCLCHRRRIPLLLRHADLQGLRSLSERWSAPVIPSGVCACLSAFAVDGPCCAACPPPLLRRSGVPICSRMFFSPLVVSGFQSRPVVKPPTQHPRDTSSSRGASPTGLAGCLSADPCGEAFRGASQHRT